MPRKLRPQAREALLNALRNGEDLSQGIVSSVVKKVAETEPPPEKLPQETEMSELEKFRADPRAQFELLKNLRGVLNNPDLTDSFLEAGVPNEVLIDLLGNDAKRFIAGENSIGIDTRGIKMEELEKFKEDPRGMLDYVRSVLPKRPEY